MTTVSKQTELGAAPASQASSSRMWLAAWMVTAVFMLSNSATPLYVRWQHAMGFSSGTLTVIFAAYIAGLLLTLLVAGQLSDRYGRKPVLIPGLLAAGVACALFATASSIIELGIARLLTGVAVGVIVSAGMASVVDVGGPERKRQASLAASISMVLGAGLGPLLAGALAQVLAQPIVAIFVIEMCGLASALLVALTLPVKPAAKAAPGWRLRLPSVPRANRRHLAYGIAVFAPGITATSFVLSLGPSLLSKLLHITSPLLAGGTACVMFLTATGLQFVVKNLSIRSIFLIGAGSTLLAMISVATAVHTSQPAWLIAAAVFAGAGQGLGQLGGLTLIGMHVEAHRRAEANAVMNIGGYIPAGLLPVATGFLIDKIGLSGGATMFAAILAAVSIFAAVLVFKGLSRD